MKYLALAVLSLLLFTCEEKEPDCYGCTIVSESDERFNCGRRGDRFQEVLSVPVRDPVCGDSELADLRSKNVDQQTIPGGCTGTIIIRTRLSCDLLPK